MAPLRHSITILHQYAQYNILAYFWSLHLPLISICRMRKSVTHDAKYYRKIRFNILTESGTRQVGFGRRRSETLRNIASPLTMRTWIQPIWSAPRMKSIVPIPSIYKTQHLPDMNKLVHANPQ